VVVGDRLHGDRLEPGLGRQRGWQDLGEAFDEITTDSVIPSGFCGGSIAERLEFRSFGLVAVS
jgi:hypothetical protein